MGLIWKNDSVLAGATEAGLAVLSGAAFPARTAIPLGSVHAPWSGRS